MSPPISPEASMSAARGSAGVFSDDSLKSAINLISGAHRRSMNAASSAMDCRVPIVVVVHVSERERVINVDGDRTGQECNLSHEVLLVDPFGTTVFGLREMVLQVFLTGDDYRGGGNVMPAHLERTSDVQEFWLYRKDGLKIIVHEANVEAVLRLVGESRGKEVLHVTLK